MNLKIRKLIEDLTTKFLQIPKKKSVPVAAALAFVLAAGGFYLSMDHGDVYLAKADAAPLALAEASAGPSPTLPFTPSPSPTAEPTPTPSPTPVPTIVVYITGAVINPGVYQLPADSRIQQAIAGAGGFAEDADQEAVNLASFMKDAQQIIVPRAGEQLQVIDGLPYTPPSAADASYQPKGQSSGTAAADFPGGLININTADLQTLELLPGIGPSMAQYIIDYREAHGGFTDISQLKNVERIGDKTYEKLKDLVTVGN